MKYRMLTTECLEMKSTKIRLTLYVLSKKEGKKNKLNNSLRKKNAKKNKKKA